MQVPVPEQAPDQPVKSELSYGFAFSVTEVPLAKVALHIKPQVIPDGVLVTVPPPVPAFWIVSSIDDGEVNWVTWGAPQPARKVER